MKIQAIAVSLLVFFWALQSEAGFIRYDVSLEEVVSFGGTTEIANGYMIFEDTGSAPGNIWPNIVDWKFVVDDFLFSPENTQASQLPGTSILVDETYNILTDFDPGPIFPPESFGPCFGTTDCDVGTQPIIFFSKHFQAYSINFPGGFFFEDVSGNGKVTYSDPIEVVISLPGTAVLFIVALAGFVARRR